MAAAKAELAGVWVLETTTGQFDDILAEQNVGWLARKAIGAMSVTLTVTQTDANIKFHMHSSAKDREEVYDLSGKHETKKTEEGHDAEIWAEFGTKESIPALLVHNKCAPKKIPVHMITYRYIKDAKLMTDIELKYEDGSKTFKASRTFKKSA